MMSIASLDALIVALATSDFTSIVGTPECDWVDFKAQPYDLNSDRGKWELAKDVAAFANARGGAIVVGVGTWVDAARADEHAAHVTLIRKSLIDRTRYISTIASWLYPTVRGLHLRWLPEGDRNDGVFIIEIPPQPEDNKHFLVMKMIDAADRTTECAIGIPVREGDQTTWLRPGEMHRLVVDG